MLIFSLGGADFGAKVDGANIRNWKPNFIEKGSVLKFEKKISGNRLYLAVKGGFKLEKWLSSASTNLTAKTGGFRGQTIKKEDRLLFNSFIKARMTDFSYQIANSLIPSYSNFPTINVIPGAELECLSAGSIDEFLTGKFMIRNDSNRMDFRLQGASLQKRKKFDLVSSAVNFGTIQLLPDGQLIILMADHQTTGGYPRITNVISRDLPLVAQLGAHDKLAFQVISIAEAENLTAEFEGELNLLKAASKFLT